MTISLTLSKQYPYHTNVRNGTLYHKVMKPYKWSNMQTTEAMVWASGGKSPPETETLLAFKRLIEAANLQISLTFHK